MTNRLVRRCLWSVARRRTLRRPCPCESACSAARSIRPHVGHLVTAVNVRHALALDVVVLMVANVPWQKAGQPADHARRATGWRWSRRRSPTSPGLVAGDAEIDRGGPSYTADTLAALGRRATRAPSSSPSSATTPRPGSTTWERYEEVVGAVAPGGGRPPGEPGRAARRGSDWIRVEVPRLEVSSTDLRARVRDGRPLDYLVTEPVLDVIAARGLYRDAA